MIRILNLCQDFMHLGYKILETDTISGKIIKNLANKKMTGTRTQFGLPNKP